MHIAYPWGKYNLRVLLSDTRRSNGHLGYEAFPVGGHELVVEDNGGGADVLTLLPVQAVEVPKPSHLRLHGTPSRGFLDLLLL